MPASRASQATPRSSKGNPSPKPIGSSATLPPHNSIPRPSLLLPTSRALQQAVLDAFPAAFPANLNPNNVDDVLQPLLQQVKHHLYHRDFAAAFAQPDLLHAYAVRWSAARALGYLDLFRDVLPHLTQAIHDSSSLKISCLGGGAGAEVAALAGLLVHNSSHSDAPQLATLAIDAVDIAEWSPLLLSLRQALVGNVALQAVKPDTFALSSKVTDLLSAEANLQDLLASTQLVTLMFTLNELYSISVSKTQKLLLDLTNIMAAGSLLLVVDSPGSYSTVSLTNADAATATEQDRAVKERKYPMAWLLDHALLKTAAALHPAGPGLQSEAPWQKIDAVESRWFRLPEGLAYPIPLENMRYQLHLFRRGP